jgi:hypothetical protein
MALTFSLAGLQTQLQLVATAIDAGDFTTAQAEYAKACTLLVGLPEQASDNGALVQMRKDLDKVGAQIAAASSASSGGDRRRLWRTGLKHG